MFLARPSCNFFLNYVSRVDFQLTIQRHLATQLKLAKSINTSLIRSDQAHVTYKHVSSYKRAKTLSKYIDHSVARYPSRIASCRSLSWFRDRRQLAVPPAAAEQRYHSEHGKTARVKIWTLSWLCHLQDYWLLFVKHNNVTLALKDRLQRSLLVALFDDSVVRLHVAPGFPLASRMPLIILWSPPEVSKKLRRIAA
jgi:hypothetical protein